MMTNLFSTFDPATSINLSMNWTSSLLWIMMTPMMFWKTPSRIEALILKINMKMYEEYKTILGKNSQGISLMMTSLFMLIMLNNLPGLLPYVFTSSSHMSYTLSMALPLWMGVMLYGWANNSEKMFAHLMPNGTPAPLMPFMVLIETSSNMIRPSSLAIRLVANMIAGHLLMSLLGNNMTESSVYIMPCILIMQMMLMLFEVAVSVIQAYVFSILMTLYSSEVNF